MTPVCSDCSIKMHKAGFTWSGRRKVQRHRCPVCGKTSQRIPTGDGGVPIPDRVPYKPDTVKETGGGYWSSFKK